MVETVRTTTIGFAVERVVKGSRFLAQLGMTLVAGFFVRYVVMDGMTAC